MDLTNDNALLLQMRDGSEQAFSKIYNKYWKKIYVLAYDRLKDAKQSQDLVQDIFVSLWERRETLDIENLNAYLYSAVRYSVFKLVAANKITDDFYNLAEALSPKASSADSRIISHELMSAFNKVVEDMPAQRKKIFKMRYEDNMKTKVIAEQLCISQKTVQNQLLSSYQTIRTLLAEILSVTILLLTYFYRK
jgi:RNA polymerase sigma-70 factor (family 1)